MTDHNSDLAPDVRQRGLVNGVRLTWAGGTHTFRLTRAPVYSVSKNDARFMGTPVAPELHDAERAILGRLLNETWSVRDLSEPIRAGLIGGGGFPPVNAPCDFMGSAQHRAFGTWTWPAVADLVTKHVLERPLAESVPVATAVLFSAVFGNDPAMLANAVSAADFARAANAALTDQLEA